MARWRRRSKSGPPNASRGPTGLNGVEELRGELESLKAELSSAQAEASERAQALPQRSRRGIAVAAGVVTVGAGVAAGVLLSDQGSKSRLAAPVTSPPRTPSPAPASPAQRTTQSATTQSATTQSATTQPATTQPAAPLPVATLPVTTLPVTTLPVTTLPVGASITVGPPPGTPTPATPPSPGGLIVVEPGQSFWSVAQEAESRALGRVPSTDEVTRYWLGLVAANRSRLVRPGDPNLIYAGQVILLPPI